MAIEASALMESVAPPAPEVVAVAETVQMDVQLQMTSVTAQWTALARDLSETGGVRDLGHLKSLCVDFKHDIMPMLRTATPATKSSLHAKMATNPGELFCSTAELQDMRTKHVKQTRTELEKRNAELEVKCADLTVVVDQNAMSVESKIKVWNAQLRLRVIFLALYF